MLKVLGRTSSINVRKVLWLCAELDIAYELEPWGDDPQSLHSPEFMALNPNAMVPVIIEDDFVLWESNSICRYLAGKQGAPLLPVERRARARVEQWMDWQATELNPAWRYPFTALVRQDPAYQDLQKLADGTAEWNRVMAILDAQLARTGAFVTGEHFSLADVVLGLSVNRWKMTPIAHAALPAVEAYYLRLQEREGFRLYGANGMP